MSANGKAVEGESSMFKLLSAGIKSILDFLLRNEAIFTPLDFIYKIYQDS